MQTGRAVEKVPASNRTGYPLVSHTSVRTLKQGASMGSRSPKGATLSSLECGSRAYAFIAPEGVCFDQAKDPNQTFSNYKITRTI